MIKNFESENVELGLGIGALGAILLGIFNIGFSSQTSILCGLTLLVILFLNRAEESFKESKTNMMLLNILTSVLTMAVSLIFIFY